MTTPKNNHKFETRTIHAGSAPDPSTGARNTPIYQTTAYTFDSTEHASSLFNLQNFGFIYSRLGNPTVSVLEERMANLENGRAAVACSTGHSAQLLALHPLMEPGDRILASQNLYGGSITQFNHGFKKFGWEVDFVDATNIQNINKVINDKHKCIFIESLSNPSGVILDVEKIAKIANKAKIPLIVDNTMASPYLFKPFDWGADIITHSLTKFIGGHGNSMGGVVIESGKFNWFQTDKYPSLTLPTESYHGLIFAETFGDFGYSMKVRADSLRDLGTTLSPTNAFYFINGLETLHLRMERHCLNALKIAKFLEKNNKVAWISYAGLESSKYNKLAKKLMGNGVGPVFTFGLKGGYEAGKKVISKVKIFSHVANVGDTRSLILHPASTTHNQLSDNQKINAGAGPEVIRLSVGIEHYQDLIKDLKNALSHI
jgi:O-acetylhomoserine (thiol)-lyase